MSKKLKILFGLSLALNLVFIGLAGGAIWKFKAYKHHKNKALFMAQKFIGDLPQERQKALLADFKKSSPNPALQTSWQDVVKAVSQEPFNGDFVKEKLAALHQQRSNQKKIISDKLIALFERMTPAERKIVRQSRMFRRMMRRNKRRDDH